MNANSLFSVEIEAIASSIHAVMQTREQESLKRTDEMLALITGSSCFSAGLAAHFGDSLPDDKNGCGACTWCTTKKPVKAEPPPPVPFNRVSFNRILEVVKERDDARLLAKIAFGISSPRITQLKVRFAFI